MLFLDRWFQVEVYWNFGKTWSVWGHFRAVESSTDTVPDQASICSAAFLCCWTWTKDSRPWQETRRCCTIPQVWEHLLNRHKSSSRFSKSEANSLYMPDYMQRLFFFFFCMLFVFLLLSVTIWHSSWKRRQGGQFGVFSGAEHRPRPPALMSCEISFQAGLQIVSQVCRACRNIHLLHSHIFFFLTSCLLRQKEPDKFSLSTKGNFGPFLTLEWYLLSWLTPAGLLNQDQGLALKTMDSGAEGSCSNTEESLQMRMFQPQKLLPCCKFYKPTLKREQRLL